LATYIAFSVIQADFDELAERFALSADPLTESVIVEASDRFRIQSDKLSRRL
jgi:hypothetical protein